MKGARVKLLIYLIVNSKIIVLGKILADIIYHLQHSFKLPIEAKEAP